MNDRDLDNMLRQLPKEEASPYFTQRVTAQLDTRLRTRRRRQLVTLAVTTVVLLLAVPVGSRWFEHRQTESLKQEIAVLRAEHRDLENKLMQMRLQMAQRQPALHLGGTDQVDYVVDYKMLYRLLPVRQEPAPEAEGVEGESL